MTNPDPFSEFDVGIGGGAGFRGAAPISFVNTQQRKSAAAGNESTTFVPTNELWELTYAAITFNTDATVANRSPYIGIFDNSGAFDLELIAPMWPAQTASQTIRWNWLLGWQHDVLTPAPQTLSSIETRSSCMPDKVFLDSGNQLQFKIFNLQNGDQMTTIIFNYRKYSARTKKLTLL